MAKKTTRSAAKKKATSPKEKEKGGNHITRDEYLARALAIDHNNAVIIGVWEGTKPRTALKFDDEGGELRRIGWPEGYDPKLAASVGAHTTLFAGGAEPIIGVSVRRGRPNGAVTRGSTDYKGKKIIIISKENPKKQGTSSYERWKLYKNGMSTDDFFKAGGKTADLKWDVEHGFIKLD